MARADSTPTAEPNAARRMPPAREGTVVMACSQLDGYRRWIRALEGTFAICEVPERKALERVMANLKPDVLVVDLALPGLRRVRGLRDIRRLNPGTKIVALTEAADDDEGVSALKAGAKGYATQDIEPETLRKAVKALQNGEVWAPRKLLRVLIGELVTMVDSHDKEIVPLKPDVRLQSLTERQRVVAHLISRGASNKEIGNRLNICERTVKAHVSEAFRNAGVSDRLHLALLLLGHAHAPGAD
jgi:two-component system, NarL family, nitrate/nitrite response regulator NarL